MTTIRNVWIKTLTLVFISSGSLTSLTVSECSAIENRVTEAGINAETRAIRIQASGQKRFDRKWWIAAFPDEQQGFIIGFSDCYYDTLRRKIRSKATTGEFQEALNQFYARQGDQISTTVPELLVRLFPTLRSNVQRQAGGEVWSERHGYLDGGYWNQSSDKERLGFLEGYIQCYEKYMTRPRVKFSRTVEEYSELLTRYFEDPSVDHEGEKIAYVLHRFAAKPALRQGLTHVTRCYSIAPFVP